MPPKAAAHGSVGLRVGPPICGIGNEERLYGYFGLVYFICVIWLFRLFYVRMGRGREEKLRVLYSAGKAWNHEEYVLYTTT